MIVLYGQFKLRPYILLHTTNFHHCWSKFFVFWLSEMAQINVSCYYNYPLRKFPEKKKANFENLIPHETEEDTMVNIYICVNSGLTLVKLSR